MLLPTKDCEAKIMTCLLLGRPRQASWKPGETQGFFRRTKQSKRNSRADVDA